MARPGWHSCVPVLQPLHYELHYLLVTVSDVQVTQHPLGSRLLVSLHTGATAEMISNFRKLLIKMSSEDQADSGDDSDGMEDVSDISV